MQAMTNMPQCCAVDWAMWDSMEAKVNGLAITMNEIKKLLLMTKGSIGPSAGNQMVNTITMEGANTM